MKSFPSEWQRLLTLSSDFLEQTYTGLRCLLFNGKSKIVSCWFSQHGRFTMSSRLMIHTPQRYSIAISMDVIFCFRDKSLQKGITKQQFKFVLFKGTGHVQHLYEIWFCNLHDVAPTRIRCIIERIAPQSKCILRCLRKPGLTERWRVHRQWDLGWTTGLRERNRRRKSSQTLTERWSLTISTKIQIRSDQQYSFA